MRYSKNKDFNTYVAGLIKSGEWVFIPKGSTKHACIRHLASGVKCPVPGSPNSISIWLGMSHIVVYWIDDAMYTEAFTKLEYAEKRIEEIKDTQGYSAYELYATKLLRVEEPVSERAVENLHS